MILMNLSKEKKQNSYKKDSIKKIGEKYAD